MILRELIRTLEEADPDLILPDGFHDPHSYRGYYEQLAFQPARHVKVSDMLADARSAVGTMYQGYKGGDYLMTEHSVVNIAPYGQSSEGDAISPRLLRLMLNQGYKPEQVTDSITVDGVHITPVDYTVTMIPDGWTGDSGHMWVLHVEYMPRRGEPGTWRVVQNPSSSLPEVLNGNGAWDYEGSEERSSREWLAEHRFTLSKALTLATEAAATMQVTTRFGPLTAADAIAREEENLAHPAKRMKIVQPVKRVRKLP